MKTTLATLALGALFTLASTAQAQTLTYQSKSVHRTATLSHRAASQQRTRQSRAIKRQRRAAQRQRYTQVRGRKLMQERAGQAPRYSVRTTQTPERVRHVIERNRSRVREPRVPGEIKPGVRIIQRRLATDAEMRGYRDRPTPRQRASRAGRVVR